MCKSKNVRFSKLEPSHLTLIKDRYRGANIKKQRTIKFPDNSIWLLVPEGTRQKTIRKAQRLMKTMNNPKEMFTTEVPKSFLMAV